LIVAGDWEGAAVKLQQAVTIDSTFAIAHFARFRVSLFLEDAASAQEALTAAMTHSYRLPERFQIFIKTRYYRLVEQDVEKALAVSQLNVELFPNDILAHVTLAELLEQLGQRQAAVDQYEQVLAMDTARYPLLLTVGSLYESLGALEEAESYYGRYAELFPTDHRSAAAQAGLLRRRGNFGAAKQMIDRALLLEPANVQLLVDAAEIEFALGEFDAARQQVERALSSAKSLFDRAEAFHALQDHHERRGQLEMAIAAMHEKWAIGEHGPRLVVLQNKLQDLRLYVAAGQRDAAFDSIAAIATRLSPPFDLFPALGRVHVALALDDVDLVETALPGLDSLISDLGLEGLRPLSLYAAGRAQALHGDCPRAIQYYEEALSRDPWHVDAEIHIASCLVTLNRSREAIRRLEEALRVNPGNAEAQALVASAYLELDDTMAARQHLDAALRIWEPADPTFLPATRARAWQAQLSREPPGG
jgi:tetratricopeptide (TPR) repeat protein